MSNRPLKTVRLLVFLSVAAFTVAIASCSGSSSAPTGNVTLKAVGS